MLVFNRTQNSDHHPVPSHFPGESPPVPAVLYEGCEVCQPVYQRVWKTDKTLELMEK